MTAPLSLAFADEPTLDDIDASGNEVFVSKPTFEEQFTKNAARVDVEKLRNAAHVLGAQEPLKDVAEAEAADISTQIHPIYAIQRGASLALEEVMISLDLIGQLRNRTLKPAEAFFKTAYVPNRPEAPPAKQIDAILYAITSKTDQLKSVAEYLQKSADQLLKTRAREERFYEDFALKLRQYNWILQSRTMPGAPRQLSVDYGFRHAGSTYVGPQTAFVFRDLTSAGGTEDEANVEKEVELAVPRGAKRVRITCAGVDDGLQAKKRKSNFWDSWERPDGLSGSNGCSGFTKLNYLLTDTDIWETNASLANARATSFELELFREIAKELSGKSSLVTNARILPQSIALPTSYNTSLEIELTKRQALSTSADGNGESTDLYENDGTILQVLAQTELRKLHKMNRAELSKVTRRASGSTLEVERPKITSDLIRRKRQMDRLRQVDKIAQSLQQSVRATTNMTLRRERVGVGPSGVPWRTTVAYMSNQPSAALEEAERN
ncbi:hypothetical protein HDV00_007835 [Rhizophlyctis rosea]|nr:hypothetical protein HDV00_007835 [Rhizophlyctis rosea]